MTGQDNAMKSVRTISLHIVERPIAASRRPPLLMAHELLQYKRQAPPPPSSPAHRTSQSPFQQQQQRAHDKQKMAEYDIKWEAGALGLRFTPNENDEPVVCQVMDTAPDAIKRSRVAVGDVVFAVQVHSIGSPMAPIATIQEMVQVFQHEELPITVRFRSRAEEKPVSIDLVDIARSYTYAWQPGQPLGVSLAMDPCTLHTIITSVDRDRISPEFLSLGPAPGDILVSVRNAEHKADLDSLRFDKVVETLKTFPRPCKLTFARLHEEVTSPTGSTPPPSLDRLHISGPPLSGNRQAHALSEPPRMRQGSSAPPVSAPPERQHVRRPAPLMKRQSFVVGERQQQQQQTHEEQRREEERQRLLSKAEARKKAKRDARFYKIVYSGGHIGLVLKDAKLELKGKPKKNGYYVYIDKVPKKKELEGLEQASEGDELIAIGTRDLQHLPFEEVQAMLSSIRSPTPLVFQRRPAGNVSVGASLVDGLFLFLI